MNNFDDLKLATEAMTGGKNTVLLDDVGMPSIMVVIPKMNSKDLVANATDEMHPGFIVDGVEKDKVYISKYLNTVQNNRGYSLPMQTPYTSLSFDSALNYCRSKGNGWGLMPASLWSAIALWCKKNNTQPRGNNDYGADKENPHEKGVGVTFGSDSKVNLTATGSGPVTWNHDYTLAGIADMNGNCTEWVAGVRLVNGVLQVIPYANCVMPSCDMGSSSADWKVVSTSGGFADMGTSICLAYSTDTNKFYWSNTAANSAATSRNSLFSAITADENITSSGKIFLRKLTLLPEDGDSSYASDYFDANNGREEAILMRSSGWNMGANSGVFRSNLNNTRGVSSATGFRSVYYDLD